MTDEWDSVSSVGEDWDSVSSTKRQKSTTAASMRDNSLVGSAVKWVEDNGGNAARAMSGAYRGAALSGLLAEPVRWGMETLNYGGYKEKIRQAFPGQTDEWYDKKYHDLYNTALTSARQEAEQQVKDNPYPGQTVGNFAAGVAGSADPTWLINPAGGIEKGVAATGLKGGARVAANIGAHAAVNAGLGSVSDLAAQGMDIAEGVKKDFDIDQNLKSAAFAGAFGGGFAGVHEASPFVKNLFKTRGIDTKPAENPVGSTTTPLTGESINFNPEQRAQFKSLLRTGSVDDIKNFLADKQGPKPTWQDVNRLVEVRDSLPEQYVGQQNFESAIQDQKRQVVQQHVADQTKSWKNAPDIEFVSKPEDIADPAIREKYIKDDPNGDALGFYGADGKVRLFQDRIDTPDMLNSVLYHESLGHHGLQQKFGASLESRMNTLLDRNVGSLKKETADWIKRNGGKYRDRKALAAEEVLAEASEKGPLKKSWGDAVAHTMREYGRRMGLKLSYSDAEIAHILSMAHDAVINGHGRNAAANGFRGRPLAWNDQNKFMFTGPKALGFDPEHPMAFTPSDGVRRNEISDHEAGLENTPRMGETKRLDEALYHPDLFENYPQLRDVKVKMGGADEGALGGYDPQTRTIHLMPHDPDPRSTILHETQHAIQHEEGIIRDNEIGNEKATAEEYNADPREKEAYLTEERKNMSFLDRYRSEVGDNKFMRKSDYLEKENAVHSIEQTYKAMDEYEPTVRPIAQTKQAAIDAGINPSDVDKLGKTPELSKRIARLAGAANVLDQRISGLLERLDTPAWSVGDEYKLQQAIVEHSYVINKLLNDQAEAGRALRIVQEFNYTKKSFESMGEVLKESGTTLAGLGDRDMLLKFARSLKTLNGKTNPNGLNTAVRQLSRHNWEDYVISLHNNMMLSGLSTHIKAPQDMIIGIGRELMENAGAAAIGQVRTALRAIGVPVKAGVHPAETVGMFYGLMRSVLEADTYRNTLSTLKTGQNPGKFAGAQHSNFARIPFVSKVGDLIAAQDTFFRSAMTNMHLYGLGARESVASGTKGWDNIMSEMSNHARFPSTQLLDEAKSRADRGLLLNENSFTKQLNKLKYQPRGADFTPRLAAFIVNYTAPFLRVASNSIMERTIRRSPLAFIDKDTRAAIAGGGPEADLAFTRAIFGLVTVWTAYEAAKKGLISGDGPQDPAKRAEKMASGWRPNSVKEADGSWSTSNTLGTSINPFDLHNATASIVANAYEAGASEENKLTALKAASISTTLNLAKQGYVGDISDTLESLFGKSYDTPGNRMDKFLGEQASSMVPNAVGQFMRVTQQDTPDTSDYPVTGKARSNLPVLRGQMPVKHDVYGQPVKTGATWEGTHGVFAKGNHQDAPTDPAIQEMVRLGDLAKNALITPVPHTIKAPEDLSAFDQDQVSEDGSKVKLTAEQYQEYQETVGKELVAQVTAEMDSGQWDRMTDEQRAQELKDIQTDVRKLVREYLYGN